MLLRCCSVTTQLVAFMSPWFPKTFYFAKLKKMWFLKWRRGGGGGMSGWDCQSDPKRSSLYSSLGWAGSYWFLFFPCLLVLLFLRMYKSKLSQVAFWSVVLSLRYQSLSTNEPYSCLVNYGEPSLCLKHVLLKLVLRYPWECISIFF